VINEINAKQDACHSEKMKNGKRLTVKKPPEHGNDRDKIGYGCRIQWVGNFYKLVKNNGGKCGAEQPEKQDAAKVSPCTRYAETGNKIGGKKEYPAGNAGSKESEACYMNGIYFVEEFADNVNAECIADGGKHNEEAVPVV